MMKSHVKTVVFLLTVSRPNTQVIPSIGKRIRAAITSFLLSSMQSISLHGVRPSLLDEWLHVLLIIELANCHTIETPQSSTQEDDVQLKCKGVQSTVFYSSYYLLEFRALTKITASIGPTNAQISP